YLATANWQLASESCYPLLMPFAAPKQKIYEESALYEYAIRALGRRMRTVAELKRLLRRRVENDEHGELLIETVIAHLKEQKYVNDSQYASTFTSLRKENNSFGKRRVIAELRQRGVHDDIIEKTVTKAYLESDEEDLARNFLRRKHLCMPTDQKQAA